MEAEARLECVKGVGRLFSSQKLQNFLFDSCSFVKRRTF